jgi:hypothetical protein
VQQDGILKMIGTGEDGSVIDNRVRLSVQPKLQTDLLEISFHFFYNQWRSKVMVSFAYARGAKSCIIRIFILPSK